MPSLTPPPTGPTLDWRVFRDWLYKLWKSVTGLTFGSDSSSYSAVIMGSSAAGDGAGQVGSVTGATGGGSYFGYISGRNRIINGSCDIAQRASKTFTAGQQGYAGPDRYAVLQSTPGGSVTQSQGSLTYQTVSYATVSQIMTTAATDLTTNRFWSGIIQTIEGSNCYDMVGQPVVVSFLFLANWTGTATVALRDPLGNQAFIQTFACTANVVTYVAVSAPPVPNFIPRSNLGGLSIWIAAQNNGTYQAAVTSTWQNTGGGTSPIQATGTTNWSTTINNTIAVTNLQVEVGNVPTPFERRSYPSEYILCNRYCVTYPGGAPLKGVTSGGLSARVSLHFPVQMRVIPTVTGLIGLNFYDGAATPTVSSIATNYSTIYVAEYDLNMSTPWVTPSRPALLYQQVSNATTTFDAEL
jgi:hypothetical protein